MKSVTLTLTEEEANVLRYAVVQQIKRMSAERYRGKSEFTRRALTDLHKVEPKLREALLEEGR